MLPDALSVGAAMCVLVSQVTQAFPAAEVLLSPAPPFLPEIVPLLRAGLWPLLAFRPLRWQPAGASGGSIQSHSSLLWEGSSSDSLNGGGWILKEALPPAPCSGQLAAQCLQWNPSLHHLRAILLSTMRPIYVPTHVFAAQVLAFSVHAYTVPFFKTWISRSWGASETLGVPVK